MRYLISSIINGVTSFDHCPFCSYMMDGHPQDIIDHMNHKHSDGTGGWDLVTIRDDNRCIAHIAVPRTKRKV